MEFTVKSIFKYIFYSYIFSLTIMQLFAFIEYKNEHSKQYDSNLYFVNTVCRKDDTRIGIGHNAVHCDRAESSLELSPYLSAFKAVISETGPCGTTPCIELIKDLSYEFNGIFYQIFITLLFILAFYRIFSVRGNNPQNPCIPQRNSFAPPPPYIQYSHHPQLSHIYNAHKNKVMFHKID